MICGVNGANKLFEQRLLRVVADADDDALGFFKCVNRLAEPEIFRRAGEMKLRKFLFQLGAGADGQLRGNQNQRAGGQMRQGAAQIAEDEVHVRFVVVIDRRVVGEPEHVGVRAGGFRVGREGKFFGGEAGGDQFVQARFQQRRLAGIQFRDIRRVKIQPDDRKMFRATRRRDAAEMPEAEDGDIHKPKRKAENGKRKQRPIAGFWRQPEKSSIGKAAAAPVPVRSDRFRLSVFALSAVTFWFHKPTGFAGAIPTCA